MPLELSQFEEDDYSLLRLRNETPVQKEEIHRRPITEYENFDNKGRVIPSLKRETGELDYLASDKLQSGFEETKRDDVKITNPVPDTAVGKLSNGVVSSVTLLLVKSIVPI